MKRKPVRQMAELTPDELHILCNRSEPVGRVGAFRGEFAVPDSFFAPLPDELLKAFGGE